MAGESGKLGKVLIGASPIAEVTGWSFKPSSNNSAWGSSDSNGFKKRVAGVKDGSGSIEGKYDVGSPFFGSLDVGSNVTLLLYVNGTDFYTVPSIIDSYDLTVDINDGEVTGFSADFSTNGEWTNPS